MRFYNPDSGDLLIDGNSIKTLDINWLRNNVTLVQQQSVLFNETIFKNIAFGRRDHHKVRKEEVKRSIETALLQYTIAELPHGLDTLVGAGGSTMSGGQKQRVAIARARLRDTPILILDEATSALDYISRTLVMDAIRDWRRGKTTIVISHDVSQIHDEEYVYVLENGVVVQEGFRHRLEKAGLGPFGKNLIPEIDFPLVQGQELHRRRSSDPLIQKAKSRFSASSDDLMDIRLHPKPNFILNVFGSLPEDIRSRRSSQALISPLNPATVPMNRISATLSTFAQFQRKNSLPARLLKDLPPLPLSPLGEIEMHHGEAGLDRKDVPTLESRKGSSVSAEVTRNLIKLPKKRKKLPKGQKARRVAPIKKILLTVWPTLPWKKRIMLICGFISAMIHAGATPAFSWVFAKLLTTSFSATNRSQMALKWSLSVLGVAVIDSVASYFMHYLLELCGQAWIDTLRVEALRRILDQPRAWFDRDKNNISKLTECLDRNAEEMRNLVGRFAGFVFVAVTMMTLAIIWSLVLCWKLTLVGVGTAPLLYALTRAFESISGKWESKSNDAGEVAGSIFAETFVNIRVVRALTLEGYFHKKYGKATNKAITVGFRRSVYSGLFFGLSDSGIIFVTGECLDFISLKDAC